MIEYLVSFVGGILSVFSPCILPVLPVIFATAEGKWWKSILVVVGLVFSFGILGLIFGFLGSFRAINYLAFAILLIFALILLFDIRILQMNVASGFLGNKMVKASASSLYPLILGLSLGVIWSPCIGPILGAIVALVAVSGSAISGLVLMLFYAFGMSVTISVILLTCSKAGSKLSERLVRNQTTINRIFGAIILLFLMLMLSGVLDSLEIFLSDRFQVFEEWIRILIESLG